MIDYGNFVFAAPPRTGSTWFIKAAAEAGLGKGFKAHVHSKAPKDNTGLVVSLVRHPCPWLASYYHVLQGGHTGVPEVDVLETLARACPTFDGFVRGYLANFEGHVTKIMLSYQADSYIRTCDIRWGAYELFVTAGVKAKTALRATSHGPQNCGKHSTDWNPSLWSAVEQSEPMIEQFEYD